MKNIIFILSFLMSFNTFAQSKKSLLRDGNELYADSSFNEAEKQYRKSLEKDQDYFNASFNLANAIYKQRQYSDSDTSTGSSTLFYSLINNAPTDEDLERVYHNLGNSLVKEGKLDNAIEAYNSALQINPNDDNTRHNYFNSYLKLANGVYKKGQYSDSDTSIGSSTLFNILINNAPSDEDLAKVYHNLGNSLVKERKLDDAIEAYKNALRINPKDEDTRYNLAVIQKQKKQQEKEQENKKENKDEQEQDKEGENKEEQEQNKEEQEQDKEGENKDDHKQNQPEEKKEGMSKEDAEKMLEAIHQKEKNLQKKLQKKKVNGKEVKVLKDW